MRVIIFFFLFLNFKLFSQEVYQKDSPYRDALVKCLEEKCSYQELPFLGFKKDKIKVSDILDRVVTTDLVLAKLFEEYLHKYSQDEDLFTLFKSINGIYLGETPSGARGEYVPQNGYIILSPLVFLTEDFLLSKKTEELKPIKLKDDVRDSFREKFSFDNGRVYVFETEIREIFFSNKEGMFKYLTSLLYHELTHAALMIRPKKAQQGYKEVNLQDIFDKYIEDYWFFYENYSNYYNAPEMITAYSYNWYMQRGEWYYGSVEPQIPYSLEKVVESFKNSNANDIYAFQEGEDGSLLIEELLMLNNYEIPSITFFAEKKELEKLNDLFSLNSLEVGWYQKSRILKPDILKRAIELYEFIFDKKFLKKGILNGKLKTGEYVKLQDAFN